MHPTPPTVSDLELARVRRFGRSFAELNARIVRLARLLGAPLHSDDDIQRIVQRQSPAATGADAAHAASGRTAQQWSELRGLLILRCNLMASMLDQLGLALSEQIVSQAEEHLERVGFKPGADGFDLLQRRKP